MSKHGHCQKKSWPKENPKLSETHPRGHEAEAAPMYFAEFRVSVGQFPSGGDNFWYFFSGSGKQLLFVLSHIENHIFSGVFEFHAIPQIRAPQGRVRDPKNAFLRNEQYFDATMTQRN